MVGNNDFHLNEATMVAAVQHYFNRTFENSAVPVVKSVATQPGVYGGPQVFVVKVESPNGEQVK